MKKLALAVLFFVPVWLHAADLVRNGDFSDGSSHWQGDGRSISDPNSLDSEYQIPPAGTNGLVIKLRGGDWTKISQDFEASSGPVKLTVTYMLSPGLTFSSRSEDYLNTTGNMGYGAFVPMKSSVNSWVIMMADMSALHAESFEVPMGATGTPRTYTASFLIHSTDSQGQKNLTLGFPPGSGFVTIEKVSIEPSSD